MAMNLELRRATPITFTDATVIELEGVGAARRFIVWECSVKVFVVDTNLSGPTDGGALPTLDARPIPADSALVEFELSGSRTFLGIAASGAGTALIEVVG